MAADQGTTIKVTVSFTDDASNAETLTSAATAAVSAAANTPATGAPTITGTPQVGQTLTAGTTAIMDADGLTSVSYTYQWIRVATDNTETNISGATASTHTLVAADQGTTIKVKVSFTDDASNPETLTSAATAAVSAAPDTTPPTLTSADVEETDELAIYLEFSEDLQLSNPPPASAFTLTVDGSAVTGFSVAWPGSLLPQNAIWLQLSTAIRQGQAVVVTYTDPTSGNDTAAIQDTAGNDAADFTTGMSGVPAVTNNSTVTNTAPTAADKTVTTGMGTAYTFTAADFGFADDDAGDMLASVKIVTVPDEGTLALDGTAVALNDVVTKAQIDAGDLIFTPVAGASGTGYASFTFKVNDGTVDSASAYTMTIDVTAAPNTAPTAADKTVTTGMGTAYAFTAADFGFADMDAGDMLASVKIVTVPDEGTLALDGPDVTLNQVVTKAQIDAGDLIFTPVAGASGTGYASFTFKVNDGTVDSASAYTMTIDVTAAPNTAPTAADKTVTTGVGTAYAFTAADFGFADMDAGDMLASVKIVTVPDEGTLALDGPDVTLNQVVTKAQIDAGDLIFTPVAGASGTGYASFTFKVNDGTVDSASAYTMTIDVTAAPNTAPTAADKTVTTGVGTAYAFTAADFGFADMDAGDMLASVKIVTVPDEGTLALDGPDVTLNQVVTKAQIDAGDLIFTPVAGASGTGYASFTFKVNDGTVDSASAYTMTIDVTAVDMDPPKLATTNGATVSGDTLTLTYDELLNEHSVPEASAFTLTGTPETVTVVSVMGRRVILTLTAAPAVSVSGSRVTLTRDTAQAETDVVTLLTYKVPTGPVAMPVQDVAGNDAPGFSVEVMRGDPPPPPPPPTNTPPVVAIPLADQEATTGDLFTYVIPADAFTDPDGEPADVYRGAERRRQAAAVADVRPGHADVHGHPGFERQWARVRDGDGE